MKSISRRGFLYGSAVTAGLLGLTACDQQGLGGTGKHTETDTDFGYTIVEQDGGKRLTYSKSSGLKLIEQDGFVFKDFEGTGELVPYEDWRLSAEERAEDLAGRLSIEQIAGLMCFSEHQRALADGNVVTDDQKQFLDGNVRAVLNSLNGYPAFRQAEWSNGMQAYVEGSANKIPINFSTDPRSGNNCPDWPSDLALGASFDPELTRRVGAGIANDMRMMGITTYLGPQTDVASDPRWGRVDGTFGEDPALSRDLCRALIDGMQSTTDESGEDMGWGTGSLVAMVKHWPAEGAAEGGREGHTDGGKYAVYPGDNFAALMIPFVDGAFKLEGKTGCVGSIMTSYTIAYDEDERYGELVGSAFSSYKVQELLREKCGFQGAACTDWRVLNDVGNYEVGWRCWGVEDPEKWDPAKRASLSVSVGVDQMGGCNDPQLVVGAYEDMVADLGEEQADANFRTSAKRLLLGYFNTGLFEDPYVDVDRARSEIDRGNEETLAAALEAQVKCIVMLKNHDGVIGKAASDAKPKVYVPMRYTPATRVPGSVNVDEWSDRAASCALPLPMGTLEKYFDVVTDTMADTLTGPADANGNPTPAEADVKRLTADDIADCDYVLVCALGPLNASDNAGRNENLEYIPLSLQYRPYTADSEYVRKVSLAGDLLEDGIRENRSYFGRTSVMTNENQLDQILQAAAVAHEAGKPCIAILDIVNPMCFYEFEDQVDAILVSLSGSTEAACNIVVGLAEPSGLLPIQMPKDMIDVERQLEDVPRDMECYTDSDGNTYDFGFGLNWAGPISDERTERYCVPPLSAPEGIEL